MFFVGLLVYGKLICIDYLSIFKMLVFIDEVFGRYIWWILYNIRFFVDRISVLVSIGDGVFFFIISCVDWCVDWKEGIY